VLDDEDDAGENRALSLPSSNFQSDYSTMAAATATTLRTAAVLPSNAASVTMSPSIIPQMIFTLQNGNAVVMQPRPALVAGAVQLISPVAMAANAMPVPTQVSQVDLSPVIDNY